MEAADHRGYRTKIKVWKHARGLLQDLEDKNMQTELEFFLYQERLTLDQMYTIHALVIYLLEKQSFEHNIQSKLHELTKHFASFVKKI